MGNVVNVEDAQLVRENLLSEWVRFGLSQKKASRDSTSSTALDAWLFGMCRRLRPITTNAILYKKAADTTLGKKNADGTY